MFRLTSSKSVRRRSADRRTRFTVASLEARLAPAVIGVTNNADSGPGSLRQAILDAAAPSRPGMDMITIDPSVTGTILLASPLVINSDVTIVGPGANKLAVSGNNLVRVFEVSDGAVTSIRAEISGLTIRDGVSGSGAGLLVGTNDELTLVACHVTGNSASGAGGGVAVADGGGLTVTGSTFSANKAAVGGAVYFSGAATGGRVGFRNATVSGNTAGTGGGVALANFTGELSLMNSTIVQNKATTGAGGGIVRLSGTGGIALVSAIVQGNTTSAATGPDISTAGTVTYRNSLLGNSSGVTTLVNEGGNLAFGTNPFVGALAANGGPVPTHAVLAGSPVIDKGVNPAPSLMTDARGATRSFGTTDIGAYEYTVAGIPTVCGTFADVTSTGGAAYMFELTFKDDVFINVANLSTGQDVFVTGPNGFNSWATFVSVDNPTNGSPRTAMYSLVPPGGTWDALDNGVYTVSITKNAVYDSAANPVPAGDIGQFRVTAGANSFLVTNTNDSGAGSLRAAVAMANASVGTTDTITFDPMIFMGGMKTIVLTTGSIAITDPVSIEGLGASAITVSGNSADRIFTIDNGAAGSMAVTISGLTLTAGVASGPGGAISIANESVTLNGMAFTNNRTTGTGLTAGGGAIALTGAGTLEINDSSFTGNKATGLGADGGAVRAADGSTVRISRTLVSGNSANGNGGGLYQSAVGVASSLTITSSAFVGNAATDMTGQGGAIFFVGTPSAAGAAIRNSTISGNLAVASGGGIAANSLGADLIIQNSTITENSAGATGKGGGVSQVGGTGRLVFESSIISGNLNALAADVFTTGKAAFGASALGSLTGIATFQDLGANLPVGAALGLGALANNGGPTPTHLPNAGSVLIDRGSNPAGLATDQRGQNRTDGVATDIGAAEAVSPNLPVAFAGPFANVTTTGGTGYDILVTFKSAVGINVASLDNNDIQVTGPNGFTAFAKFVSVDDGSNGSPRVATYRLAAPGGTWDGADAGLYTVSLVGGQVVDTLGGAATGITFGTFIADLSTTYVVTNAADSGAGSLRDALARANLTSAPDTITFEPTFFATNRTIGLTSGQLTISAPVHIMGTGAGKLAVNGNNLSRVFNINDNSAATSAVVVISGMTINGGRSSTEGGGIYVYNENVSLIGVEVRNNSSTTGSGGGIFVADKTATLTLVDSMVSANSAGLGQSGGGIRIQSAATVSITRSTISGNTAQLRGGGIYFNNGGSLLLDSSAVTGNVAQGKDGGGVYFFGAITPAGLTIRNTTVSGNSAGGAGGGIAFTSVTGTPVIQNSTITGNVAGNGLGGGIARVAGFNTLTLVSTIVAGNAGAVGPDLGFNAETTISSSRSLIGVENVGNVILSGTGNLTGTVATPLDPMLEPLALNSGTTQSHALKAGSPAINAGSNPAGLAFDQRGVGFARVSGGSADIGAFEIQQSSPVTVSGFSINDGQTQRSRVLSVTVTFSGLVNFVGAPADAFKIEKMVTGVPTGMVSVNVDLSGSTPTQTIARLTFVGPMTEFGSLSDGSYRLTVVAANVTNGSGDQLDGNGDGTAGDDFVSASGAIHRLFGDINGDRTVNSADFLVFRTAFLSNTAAFDINNDGIVGAEDFLQFRLRFTSSV